MKRTSPFSKPSLRIGILGASSIAPQAVMKPGTLLPQVEVAAVAARNEDKAQAYAETHGIPLAYGGYDALLEGPEIHLVYNGLPPSHHAEWSIRALEAGKHVLCEKPIGMNADEALAMTEAARLTGGRLVEAFHCRYHPAFQTCLDWIRAGEIGAVQSIQAHFGVGLEDDGKRNQYRPELGGGTMMDMGCYPLTWVRQVLGDDVAGLDVKAPLASSGVDLEMEAELRFASGAVAKISSSMHPETPFRSYMYVTGTDGEITFENPLVPHEGASLTLKTEAKESTAQISPISTYAYQLRAVADEIARSRVLPTEGKEIVAQQRALDRLYHAAGLGYLRQTRSASEK